MQFKKINTFYETCFLQYKLFKDYVTEFNIFEYFLHFEWSEILKLFHESVNIYISL